MRLTLVDETQNGAVSNLYTTNCSVAPSVVWNPHFILVHLVHVTVFNCNRDNNHRGSLSNCRRHVTSSWTMSRVDDIPFTLFLLGDKLVTHCIFSFKRYTRLLVLFHKSVTWLTVQRARICETKPSVVTMFWITRCFTKRLQSLVTVKMVRFPRWSWEPIQVHVLYSSILENSCFPRSNVISYTSFNCHVLYVFPN